MSKRDGWYTDDEIADLQSASQLAGFLIGWVFGIAFLFVTLVLAAALLWSWK